MKGNEGARRDGAIIDVGMGAGMLTVISYVAILAMAGPYYLLAMRFAPEMPFGLLLGVALLVGLLMALVNHLVLACMFGIRRDDMGFHDWRHLLLVFVVSVGVMLNVSQLVLTHQLREPRVGQHVTMLVLNLLLLGLSTLGHAAWLRSRQRSADNP